MFLRSSEPLAYQVRLGLRRLHALLRFLLESVEHIHGTRELDGLHRPQGTLFVVLNYLQDPSAAEALEGFGVHVLPAGLRLEEANPIVRRTASGKTFRSLLAGPDPEQRLRLFAVTH